MVVNLNWPLYQLDVFDAFLYGDLNEKVYMEQPPDYIIETKFTKVCHLRKVIYSLK